MNTIQVFSVRCRGHFIKHAPHELKIKGNNEGACLCAVLHMVILYHDFEYLFVCPLGLIVYVWKLKSRLW